MQIKDEHHKNFETFSHNISLTGHAFQSSLSQWSYSVDEANHALKGFAPKGFAFHTQFEESPWWAVDLQNVYFITGIKIEKRKNYNN